MQWGNLTLYATTQALTPRVHLEELDLIADRTANTPQSSLIGGGRGRRRYAIAGEVSPADYASLMADHEAMTARTFVGDVTMTALIDLLDGGKHTAPDLVAFQMTVVEA
jgi:hypothetical protein